MWSGNALLSRCGIFSVPANSVILRLFLDIKIAASRPARSSERAWSALEAAGAGWLDAGGYPAASAVSSLVISDGALVQLALLSQSDSSSDRTMTYAGAAFSFTSNLTRPRQQSSDSVQLTRDPAGYNYSCTCYAKQIIT